jgi:hypothetical protein
MRYAGATATRLTTSFPDGGRASEAYLTALTEAIYHLTTAQIDQLMDPAAGILTTSKYLPTIAEIHAFLNVKVQQAEQFRPRTSYKRLEPGDNIKQPPLEIRKQQVRDALGYDPQRKHVPIDRSKAEKPTAEDLAAIAAASKIPPGPISPELRQKWRDGL